MSKDADAVKGGCLIFALLLWLTFWGAVLYVAFHFITKYW